MPSAPARPPVQDLGPDRGKGIWRLMPSSMRQRRGERSQPQAQPVAASFPSLDARAPRPPERELKTLAEMRPDEIDAALPNVHDLYDRVSDQNATTF
jgi:hypothetical protein